MQKNRKGALCGNYTDAFDGTLSRGSGRRYGHPGELAGIFAECRTKLQIPLSGPAADPPPTAQCCGGSDLCAMGTALWPSCPPRLHWYCGIWPQPWPDPGTILLRRSGHLPHPQRQTGAPVVCGTRRQRFAVETADRKVFGHGSGTAHCHL